MRISLLYFSMAVVAVLLATTVIVSASPDQRPVVVEVTLDKVVQPVSAEYVMRGIRYANQINAAAVLFKLNTPGGLEPPMREIIHAILSSRVPVITFVAPSGARAASAGFFILLAGDVAVMAPGTHAGAAHPVVLGAIQIGKVMETKIENDAAAYIRSLADKRGRNAKLAEEGVRESRSYTEKEALEGKLIDGVASSARDIFAQFDGKTVVRMDNTSVTLHLAEAEVEPYEMTGRERFLSWIVDPNIAFLLGALGVICLYIEFTHPGMIAPGVAGAISLILALFAFHLLPINYAGVVLILMALALFVLEAMITSHGVLGAGGVVAMIIGSLILVDSPWPGGGISLATALSVTLPLAMITVILVRYAWLAKRRKVVTGEEGMVGCVGVARTDLDLEGKVLARGEIWDARALQKIPRGTRVRVQQIEGLTLLVEPWNKSR